MLLSALSTQKPHTVAGGVLFSKAWTGSTTPTATAMSSASDEEFKLTLPPPTQATPGQPAAAPLSSQQERVPASGSSDHQPSCSQTRPKRPAPQPAFSPPPQPQNVYGASPHQVRYIMQGAPPIGHLFNGAPVMNGAMFDPRIHQLPWQQEMNFRWPPALQHTSPAISSGGVMQPQFYDLPSGGARVGSVQGFQQSAPADTASIGISPPSSIDIFRFESQKRTTNPPQISPLSQEERSTFGETTSKEVATAAAGKLPILFPYASSSEPARLRRDEKPVYSDWNCDSLKSEVRVLLRVMFHCYCDCIIRSIIYRVPIP